MLLLAQPDAGHTHAADLVGGPPPNILLSHKDGSLVGLQYSGTQSLLGNL